MTVHEASIHIKRTNPAAELPCRGVHLCAETTEKPNFKRFRAQKKSTVILSELRWTYGGPGGIRTLDLCVANAALSQLSYGPIFCSTANIITQSFKKIQSYFLFFAIFCMQKGTTALGRPFPHKLFVYFAAHDIETPPMVPRDGSIDHITEIVEDTQGKITHRRRLLC